VGILWRTQTLIWRFDVGMLIALKITVFCDVLPRRLADRYRHIEETFCLHLQGIRVEIETVGYSETYQSSRRHIIEDSNLYGINFLSEPATSFLKCIFRAKVIGNKRLCFLIAVTFSVTILSLLGLKSKEKYISQKLRQTICSHRS
jgi:hypothetical protein